MTWSAKVIRKERQGNRLDIIIEYSNESGAFTETLSTSLPQNSEWLGNQTYKRIDQLTKLDAFESSITPGSLTPIAPASVDPKDLAYGTFQDLFSKVQQIRLMVNQGVLGTTEAATTLGTLIPATKSAYKAWGSY